MSNIIEVNQLTGTVEYGYHRSLNHTQNEDSEIYMEKFHNLEEFLKLTNESKLKEIKEKLHAVDVIVEAVCFNTTTPDSQTKVELLMMKDEFYGQVIQSA